MRIHFEFNHANPLLDLLVEVATDYIMKDLGLDKSKSSVIISTERTVTIGDMDCLGLAEKVGSVYYVSIKSSLSVKKAINTLAHELRHIWQFVNGWTMDMESPYYERPQEIDAFAYGDEFTERMIHEIYDAYKARKLLVA